MTDAYIELPHLHDYKVTLTVNCPSPSPVRILSFWEYSYIDFIQVAMLYSIGVLNIIWNEGNIRVKMLEYCWSKKLPTPLFLDRGHPVVLIIELN